MPSGGEKVMEVQPFHDTNGLLREVSLPDLLLLRQRFPRPRIDDVGREVISALERATVAEQIQPGQRIAIAVGSRGVAEIATIVRSLVAALRGYGAAPFIVPAMGSHGGATAEGQQEVLHSLGVTEAYVGAPIISSLEVDVLGTLPNGLPVHIDRTANRADGIIVVNRIKPHTDFTASIESGLSKMLAIGLGKHAGALTIHSWGYSGLMQYLPEVAKFTVKHAPILFGLATVENAYDEVAEIVVVPPDGIGNKQEQVLLERAKSMMPRLPWDELDVLVVDQIGKNISGAGMDPNIMGRLRHGQKDSATRIINITVHDITDESHGNAIGIGHADFTTSHVLHKIDFQSVYINVITAGVIAMESGKIPLVVPTDREAVAAAIRSSGKPDFSQVSLARIENTLRLEYILANRVALEQIRTGSDVEVIGSPMQFPLRADGSLAPFHHEIVNI
jgi:hypothetical protein